MKSADLNVCVLCACSIVYPHDGVQSLSMSTQTYTNVCEIEISYIEKGRTVYYHLNRIN